MGVFDIELEEFVNSSIPYCLTFWYHMFGKNVGAMNVRLGTHALFEYRTIFTRYGDLQNKWYKAEIEGSAQISDKVMHTFFFLFFCYLTPALLIKTIWRENYQLKRSHSYPVILLNYITCYWGCPVNRHHKKMSWKFRNGDMTFNWDVINNVIVGWLALVSDYDA